ncbi:TetR/AcrR family transcriptional regulator [Roseovarius autotrophicus]|uniref:TetR/AcrR family transcriptional regulator n=1 Tax=Roseovarius autotrophicus TaxID=2824121 RepID=UPI001A0847F7|nr:TetR/AcrR family transcriptional regulator [Roseovarius autotrophicus]MBE0452953.1 TetR/AcrR family transcriptional regulator [Roseovarius sp.]
MTAQATEIKKGRKFDQVLEGARRVFMRDGFEGASVDEIAREAKVSKATLYSYFPDKRLLFSEVARLECNRQADEAIDAFDLTQSVETLLREVADRILRFYLSDFGQQVFRICVAESHRFPELGRRFYTSGPKLARDRLSLVLRVYVERGALRIEDMDLAADQFVELCKGDLFVRALCGLCQSPDNTAMNRVADGAVEMFLARYRA